LIIGSFLNVCIVRIPGRKSVVLPASACPRCAAPIHPYDNIPVVSYLLLGGKCRACRTRISAMYPLVELLTALLFFACYRAFGLTAEGLKWAAFSALMIVLVFTDLRERILPDVVTFSGFGLGLALSLFTSPADGAAQWLANRIFGFSVPAPALSFADAVFGAALGSGLLWLVSEAYFRLRGREGMGQGDVKMMLMAGAFLGAKRTLLTILAGSLLGSVVGLLLIGFLYLSGWKSKVASRAHRMGLGTVKALRCVLVQRYQLPFGTYLGLAGIAVFLFGTPVVNWYQSLLMVR
jgi:leader peptidase (prepilin peptidase)/N-methyltransferase